MSVTVKPAALGHADDDAKARAEGAARIQKALHEIEAALPLMRSGKFAMHAYAALGELRRLIAKLDETQS